MKKFLIYFLVIALIGTTFLGNSFLVVAQTPSNKLILKTNSLNVKQNSTFTVEAFLDSGEAQVNVASFGPIDIQFDAGKIEFVALENNTSQADEMEYNLINGNTVRVIYLDNDGGNTPLESNTSLFALSFKVKETPYYGVTGINILKAEGFGTSTAQAIPVCYDSALSLNIIPKGSVNLDLRYEKTSAKIGSTVAVQMDLSNYDEINDGIAAFGPLDIAFDSAKYEFLTATPLNGIEESEISTAVSGNRLRILYVDEDGGNSPISFSGAVLNLSFKIREDANTGNTSFKVLSVQGMVDSALKPIATFVGQSLFIEVTPKETVKLKADYSKRVLYSGEEFSMDISIDSFENTTGGLAAFGPLDIEFDASQFEFLGANAQNEMKDSELSYTVLSDKGIRILYVDDEGGNTPLIGLNTICSLHFKVKNTAVIGIGEFKATLADGFITSTLAKLTAEIDSSKKVLILANKSWALNNNKLSNLAPSTTAAQIKNGFDLPQNVRILVKKTDGAVLKDEEIIGTGMTVQVLFGDEIMAEYSAVVFGDVNGDGSVNSIDLLKVKRYILGIETLKNIYLEATNTNHDGNGAVNSIDLLRLKRHILGIITISQQA